MAGTPGLTGMYGSDEPTELQHEILDAAERNPEANAEQLAALCDCSASYVRDTIDKYGDPAEGGPFGGVL